MLLYYKILLPELARLGHDVRVVVAAPFSPAFPAYDCDGVAVECVPAEDIAEQARHFGHLGPTPRLARYLGAAWAAWEFARARSHFDVVEVADWGLLFAPWIAEDTGPAVSVTLHGSAGQIDLYDAVLGTELEGIVLRLLEAALLAGADDLVASGRSNGEAWERITGRSVRVIPPAFPVMEPPQEAGSDRAGLVVARVQYWKGPHVLCEALRRVTTRVPPLRWVGRDMPYRMHSSMSRMLSERYPEIWGARIEPLGARTSEETAALERRAAFVVVPSLWDVFNLVTVEALSFGKVVIVSNGAGASELITHGVDGLVWPAGDAGALASLLDRVVAMGDVERREMGRRGRQLVEQALDPRAIARRRGDAYAQAAERRSRMKRAAVSPWVRDAIRPGQSADVGPGFLEHVALRDLAAHAGGRILGRVRDGLTLLSAGLRGSRATRRMR
jgi:glycosyltransferase involved in cell wall biosynthesis